MRVVHMRVGLALLAAAVLSACDASVLLWPWVEREEETTETADRVPPPPPPLVPVNPLNPEPVSAEPGPVVPNPNANAGAPVEGTPFIDLPENPEVPIVETPVDASTGQPIAIPPPVETAGPVPDAPPPTDPQPGTPAPETPAPIQPAFFYHAPGSIEPASGAGSTEPMVFVREMAFPIQSAPSFPQSQVYRYGGGVKGGDQCDPRNFSAPWRDNYCEKRSGTNATPWCAASGVHLGQDIRVGTPEGCKAERSAKAADRERYAVVATEDGVISNVGSYSVSLRAGGRIYRYLHLNMAKLRVKTGDTVRKGDVIGFVSNDFGGTPTTLHLHFEIKMNTSEHGWAYVPPYSSLLAAYQRREGNMGALVTDGDASVGVASAGGGATAQGR